MKIYYTLNNNFLRMRVITKQAKENMYKSIFSPILTYGCESWGLTTDIRSRIQAVEINKRNSEKRQNKKRRSETGTEC